MYQVFLFTILTSEYIFMIQSKMRQDILPSLTLILNRDTSGLCLPGWWGCLGSLNKILMVHLVHGGYVHTPYLLRVSNLPPCLFSWPCLFLTLYSPSLGEPIVISHGCLLIWSLYKNLLLFFLEFFFFSFGALFYLFLSVKKITSKRLAAYSALFSSDFSLFNTYPLIQPRLILIYSMKEQSKILFLQIEKHFDLFYFWDRVLWCSLGWYGTSYVAQVSLELRILLPRLLSAGVLCIPGLNG